MGDAKYKAVAAALRSDIMRRDLMEGDKIGTEFELMSQFGVSRQTIRHAIELLINEGYLNSRRGSGTFVAARVRAPSTKPGDIAVICSYMTEYIFPSIIRGIDNVLSENGYSIILKATNNRVDMERAILTALIDSPPQGIIIEGSKTVLPNPNMEYFKRLETMGIPIVFIHAKYPQLDNFVEVAADDYRGGYDAVKYLYSKGHTNISGIFKSTDLQSLRRYAGFMNGVLELGIPFRDQRIIWFQDNEQLQTILESTDFWRNFADNIGDCTASVCYNDQVACMLMAKLAQMGYPVPDSGALIGFDDSVYSSLVNPGLTTFAHPKERLGRLAAEKIINMIHGIHEESAILPWTLVERGSVKDINKEDAV